MDSNDEQEVEQIRISLQLAKGCPDTSLKVPSDPIAVPATTRKKGLSAIVNHLLGRKVVRDKSLSSDRDRDSDDDESDDDDDDDEKLPSLPFDFLVNNKLLRLSIESAARKEGLSLETAVEIQYFPARLAPQSDGESEVLPDWISAMSYSPYEYPGANGNGVLYTASCDGSIRFFHNCDKGDDIGMGSFRQGGVIKAHSGSVKCISSLTLCNNNNAVDIIASGSMDQTLVSHIHHRGKDHNDNNSLALHAVYSGGHNASINSVVIASVNGCTTLVSGDWDGGLCVWKVPSNNSLSSDESNVAPKRKKQKGSSSAAAAVGQVSEISPTSFFRAHKSNISGIVWGHETDTNNNSNGQSSSSTLFTASWDHSIKAWDVESQNEILALNGSKVITSLGRCHNSNVVATGHPDCTVRLWDMRSSSNSNSGSGNVFDGTLRPSHKSWISAVEWSPNDPFVLASSSHDGSVKVWDIRSSLPLHTVRAHEKGQKSLCLGFANRTIFSGGTDCIVKKFRF